MRRNGWYGFRVSKTLSDDKFWYPVNKSWGKWLMISGLALIAFALVLPSLGMDTAKFCWTMIALAVLSTFAPMIFSYRLLKTIH